MFESLHPITALPLRITLLAAATSVLLTTGCVVNSPDGAEGVAAGVAEGVTEGAIDAAVGIEGAGWGGGGTYIRENNYYGGGGGGGGHHHHHGHHGR
jgi:hypothetical protein